MQKKLDYAALAKAREEARQLQIYKANAEMLLRTDADDQRQTREHQQEKQHCNAGRSRTGTVRSIKGFGEGIPQQAKGDFRLPEISLFVKFV